MFTEAENLSIQLTEKMSANTEKRLLLSHSPITLVCLEVKSTFLYSISVLKHRVLGTRGICSLLQENVF